jgi:hypothetical protein
MKKILLACEGSHFSEGAFEFVRKLNEKETVLLAGVFLSSAEFSSLWSYADGMSGPLFVPVMEEKDEAGIHESVERFTTLCRKNGIEFRIHEDFFDFALSELRDETRFADLLIISSEHFYENLNGVPNQYLLDTLHDAECPVIVVPEQFSFPEKIILAYDGSPSAVFSIKQLSYLFPEWNNRPVQLVVVQDDAELPEIPFQVQMEEWAARHFTDLTLIRMGGTSAKEFEQWLTQQKNALLVAGSFGRSGLSRILRKSFVSEIIRHRQMPVFIAHR